MKYFAYGANLLFEKRIPKAIKVSNGTLLNYKLRFNKYLTIDSDPNSIVEGVILEINKADELMLDIYEGYGYTYYKEDLLVSTPAGVVSCMNYIMIEEWYDYKYDIPSSFYYREVLDGYRKHELDQSLLKTAFTEVCREVKKFKKPDTSIKSDLDMESTFRNLCGSEKEPFDTGFGIESTQGYRDQRY